MRAISAGVLAAMLESNAIASAQPGGKANLRLFGEPGGRPRPRRRAAGLEPNMSFCAAEPGGKSAKADLMPLFSAIARANWQFRRNI